ncbi:MAG: 5-formyltetrahydrofolate cyclo-ligase [Actinobacteria bacterium]|jgi:5-formyltetrahydrofolate cyclo-ligase|uniref:Unannotated protein n=1 Tax=freshwater metagenome TaxID=449393 RepID=A0A6J5ZJP5_9ZZZZ|nr:5-formyltetrahydrofolate cyclo-ligase [Actinomycetota bacterium]
MGSSNEKVELRTRYRRERTERYLEHSFEYLAEAPEFVNAQVIASYVSYNHEPDTSLLNAKLIQEKKTLVLPKVTQNGLEWIAWDGALDSLSTKKKIKEPTGNPISDLSIIDLVIVPALRIDRSGFRLGQGGGYYDRALPHLRAWSIGLIHPDEISSEDLPREPWDIPLNAAATPDLVIRFKN